MKKLILTTSLLVFVFSIGLAQKDLNIDFMLRGQIYAASSMVDSTALGGFGGSDNSPKSCDGRPIFSGTGLYLRIDTTQKVVLEDQYNGYKLFIVNKSDAIVELDGSDSRLPVIAEVYHGGEWQPIEYLPSSWCGNSYHQIYLDRNAYWEFDVPKFTGKIKTKLRYRLEVGTNQYIYSNEIATSFNRGQLKEKQGHTPNGIMDPYND